MASERELVAKAICNAAGRSVHKSDCLFCEGGRCTYWQTFLNEADAAIAVIRTVDMHAQARSILHNRPKLFNI